MSLFWISILAFSAATFVNVVLGTLRSILTIKASRQVSAIVNAISFGFYMVVLKQLEGVDMISSVVVTVVMNYVGVLFAVWVLARFKKDVMWVISVRTSHENAQSIIKRLIENHIGYSTQYISQSGAHEKQDACAIEIYSQTQAQSTVVRGILNYYDDIIYFVLANENVLY